MPKRKKNKTVIPNKEELLGFAVDTVRRVQREYGMSDYRIIINYVGHAQDDVMADISVDHKYLRATINLYPIFAERYQKKDYEELREALCHEVFHIKTSIIDEMANNRWGTPDIIRQEIERLTEMYGRLVYKVMTAEGKFKK